MTAPQGERSWWVTWQCPVCELVESRRLEAEPGIVEEAGLEYDLEHGHTCPGAT